MREELLDIPELKKWVKKWFGLKLHRGFKITIIDVKNNKDIEVDKPSNIDPKEERSDPILHMNHGGNITVNLQRELDEPIRDPNIHIYQQHVWVISIRLPYLIEAIVNWDGLELEQNREDYVENKEFINKVEQYFDKMGYKKEIIPEHKPMAKEDFKCIKETFNKAVAKIAERWPDKIPMLYGVPNTIGIPGTSKFSNGNNGKDWETQKVTYMDNAGDPKGNSVIDWWTRYNSWYWRRWNT